MADQHVNEGSSSSSSDATVELKIKTLDSQIYSFQVKKTMLVSLFKEKVASRVGIPVGQQRLIFRGKVLKDEHALSEYQVENGDTFHLVERQQPQSDTASRETSGNNDNRGTNDVPPHNRIGQIAHSVVLGTFNVGEQGEAMGPDLGRVIGAVLNSFGIGQTATNVTTGPMSSNPPNAQGEISGENGISGAQRRAGTQAQSGQAFASQPFQSIPQVVQTPVPAAAIPFPLASLQTPVPDSLNTLLGYMNHMEQALTQDGYQPNSSSTNTEDVPRVELPSNAQGVPTIEAMSIVLRNAQHLLNNRASAALSHLAGRLEQEGTSSDSATRTQIQTEAIQIGLAMQHIGALLLELGRSIMTLRMGQPVVNSGPAVYISPTGPNPIMVQPSPLQTNSFFGGPIPTSNPVISGPVGIGNPPRNISIHIHAGTSLAPMLSTAGSRTSAGEGTQREHGSAAGSAEAGAARVLPVRITSTVPTRPASVILSSPAPSNPAVSASQPSVPLSMSSLLAGGLNQVRNEQGDNQGQSAQPGSIVGDEQRRDTSIIGVQESGASLPQCTDALGQKVTSKEDSSALNSKDITMPSSGGSVGDFSKGDKVKIDDASNALRSNEKNDDSGSAKSVPLGLGLGGLGKKRLNKQQKISGDGATSAPHDHDQNATVNGQQVLQALASRSSSTAKRESNLPLGQSSFNIEQSAESQVSGRPGSDGPFDMASAMSQALQSPALNGLLAGVSGQAGAGSSDALGTMMQQFTQNPAMMNVVSQIAQQVDEQEIENMFSGAGRDQGGGIDFSRMIQQMMPVVTRALSGSQNLSRSSTILEAENHQQQERRETKDEKDNDQKKVNLQEVVQRIEHSDAPEEIFHSMIQNATHLHGNDRMPEDFTDELCNEEELASAYAEMLYDDLSSRLEED